jgi:quinol monooxygenase YgiN
VALNAREDAMTESDAGPVTLINVFKTAPEKQDELLRLLSELTDDVFRELPGFVSAVLHRGVDGRHVANYAEWESIAAWRAMVQHPRVRERMNPIPAIATFEPHLYSKASEHRG